MRALLNCTDYQTNSHVQLYSSMESILLIIQGWCQQMHLEWEIILQVRPVFFSQPVYLVFKIDVSSRKLCSALTVTNKCQQELHTAMGGRYLDWLQLTELAKMALQVICPDIVCATWLYVKRKCANIVKLWTSGKPTAIQVWVLHAIHEYALNQWCRSIWS